MLSFLLSLLTSLSLLSSPSPSFLYGYLVRRYFLFASVSSYVFYFSFLSVFVVSRQKFLYSNFIVDCIGIWHYILHISRHLLQLFNAVVNVFLPSNMLHFSNVELELLLMLSMPSIHFIAIRRLTTLMLLPLSLPMQPTTFLSCCI